VKKIAVIALNNTFNRSWISTGILKELSQHYEISVFTAFESEINNEDISLKKFIKAKNLNQVTFLKNVAWIAYRNRCISFKFTLTRWYLSNFYWYQKKLPKILRFKFFIKQTINYFRKALIENKLSIFYFFPFKKLIFKILLLKLREEPAIKNLLAEFDLVIFHSCTLEKEFPIILKSIQNSKTKSLMVLESWDNLTSKQIFLVKPNYIGVIGLLDVKNAIDIHGFKEEQIFQVGLPKFEILKKFDYKIQRNSTLKTILYVGFFLPHDEITLLNKLQKMLVDENRSIKILYRPHPGAKSRLFKQDLDPNIQITKKWVNTELPPLDAEYMADVLTADVVIGPPTTFLLETMLIGIPTLIDLTNDKVHRTTSANCAKNYLHIKQFVSLFHQNSFDNVENLKLLLDNFDDERDYLMKNKLKDIVYQDEESYGARLSHIIESIS